MNPRRLWWAALALWAAAVAIGVITLGTRPSSSTWAVADRLFSHASLNDAGAPAAHLGDDDAALARRAALRWSASDIQRTWTTVTGPTGPLLRSPAIALADPHDAIDAIVIELGATATPTPAPATTAATMATAAAATVDTPTMMPTSAAGSASRPASSVSGSAGASSVRLLWSDAEIPTHGDYARNRREWPAPSPSPSSSAPASTSSIVVTSVASLSDDRSQALRHLFLSIPERQQTPSGVLSLAVVTRLERLTSTPDARTHLTVAGDARAATYVRVGAGRSWRITPRRDAFLRLGIYAPDVPDALDARAAARLRIEWTPDGRLSGSGTPSAPDARIIQTIDLAAAHEWKDVDIPLTGIPSPGVLTISVEDDDAATRSPISVTHRDPTSPDEAPALDARRAANQANAPGVGTRDGVFVSEPTLFARSDARYPNIIVFVADALRADHVGAYAGGASEVRPSDRQRAADDAGGLHRQRPGGPHAATPFLDDLARRGLVFEHAYTAATWTKPSIASLLTGLYPATHGMGSRYFSDQLPAGVPTLASILRAHGYTTLQWSGNGFSGALSGLDAGFDRSVGPSAFGARVKVTANDLNGQLLPWLDAHRRERFFVYVQAMDTHPPLDTSTTTAGANARESANSRTASRSAGANGGNVETRDGANRIAVDRDLASGGIAGAGLASPTALTPAAAYARSVTALDAQVARLYEQLVRLDLAENTLLVFTADHGEAFGEHGQLGHGQSVYEEEAHVPLIMHWPRGLMPARSRVPLTHVDLLPTLLAYAGIPFDRSTIEGRSVAGRAPASSDAPIFLTRFTYPEDAGALLDRRAVNAVIDYPWKSIAIDEPGAPPRHQLFDLRADPEERHDRSKDNPELAARLSAVLQQFLNARAPARARFLATHDSPTGKNATRPPQPAMSPEVLERLRSLGYVK